MKLSLKLIKLSILFISAISLNAFSIKIDKITSIDSQIKLKIIHFYDGPRFFTNFIPIRWDSYLVNNQLINIPINLKTTFFAALTKHFDQYDELTFPECTNEFFCDLKMDDSSYIYVYDEYSGIGTYIVLSIDSGKNYYYMIFTSDSIIYEEQTESNILVVTNAINVQHLNFQSNVNINLKLSFKGFKVNENTLLILDLSLEENKYT